MSSFEEKSLGGRFLQEMENEDAKETLRSKALNVILEMIKEGGGESLKWLETQIRQYDELGQEDQAIIDKAIDDVMKLDGSLETIRARMRVKSKGKKAA